MQNAIVSNKQKAVVLLSGGQDSTTCLFYAKSLGYEIFPLTIYYGQRHQKEMEYAQRNAAKVTNHEIKAVDLSAIFGNVSTSFLTDTAQTEIGTNAKGLPTTYTPNRNLFFLATAHAYAQQVEASAIFTGVCQTDFSGYPDCRRAFIDAFEEAANLGSDSQIKVFTPLMFINKAKTFELAKELGVLNDILFETLTCYYGNEKPNDWGLGCGQCPACELRKKGYDEFIEKT